MDLFQLTYFIEVAHKKSFTKASKSLHISQPSISKGIKALEEHWGVQLFDRKGKNVELTETGSYLLPKIEELIKGFTQLNEEMESPQLLNSGKLSVGVPPMIGSSVIAPFIAHFINTYPKIELEMKEVGSQDVSQPSMTGSFRSVSSPCRLRRKSLMNSSFSMKSLSTSSSGRIILWPPARP